MNYVKDVEGQEQVLRAAEVRWGRGTLPPPPGVWNDIERVSVICLFGIYGYFVFLIFAFDFIILLPSTDCVHGDVNII